MVFGRKKKQEQAEAIMDAVLNATGEADATDDPASAPTPKAKKSKSTISGQSKSKPVSDNFIIVHAEKITLTLAVLLSGYLIYAGFNSGMNENGDRFSKTVDNLKTSTTSAENKIKNGDWAREQEEVYPNGLKPTYEERATASQIKIKPSDYKLSQLFNPPINRSTKKREDPELYAPTDLHAVALTGPVAYLLAENEIDPTADDEPAQRKIEEKRPVKPRPSRDDEDPFGGGGIPGMEGGGMDGMPGMGMGMGMGDGMPGADDTNSNEPIRRLRVDRGQISGYRPTGGAAMGGMDGGMGGMPGMDGGMGGMPGMDGGMDGMPGMGGDTGGGSAVEETGPKGTPVARARTMVAVTALVPFKKQFDEYERALAMRSGYDSYRDQPNYVFMYVERVDVTNDPTQVISEDQWQQNYLHTKMHRAEAKKWHGTANEIVDPTYLNPYISLSCPPVMMRDLENLLRHPDIPLAGMSNQDVTETEATQPDEEPEDNDADSNLPGGAVTNNRPSTGSTTQTTPGGGDPSMGGGMGGMPGMGGMGGMGGMPGMGMGMGGMDGMGGEVLSANIPDYKLVRFFDFGAEIGHTYRYRVQLLVEDPNHPNTSPEDEYPDHRPPNQRTLEDDVLLRIKDIPEREFFRRSNWSEPSEAITVPSPLQFAGGSVDPKKFSRDSTGKTYQDTEPAGQVKTIDWDQRRAVDVQFDRPVHRGSILNFTADAEYGHPISEIIMAASAHAFQTGFIVGDIRGGDELPLHTKDNPYYAPGEFLLIDSAGNLTVRSELDDTPLFRRYDYTPDAPLTGAGGTGGGAMGGMEGMMPGMDGGEEGGMPGF
ncbi:MAG: hypothetical protein VX738_07840 [Planctomycetota bacterium]|nr:hypothetical protein [Planctomycetota bacterium]